MARPRGLSHRTIVELLGDMTAVADALGIKPANNVAHWKKAGRGIPPLYWLAISQLARRQGYRITVADLARTSPSPRARRQRQRLDPAEDSRELAA